MVSKMDTDQKHTPTEVRKKISWWVIDRLSVVEKTLWHTEIDPSQSIDEMECFKSE